MTLSSLLISSVAQVYIGHVILQINQSGVCIIIHEALPLNLHYQSQTLPLTNRDASLSTFSSFILWLCMAHPKAFLCSMVKSVPCMSNQDIVRFLHSKAVPDLFFGTTRLIHDSVTQSLVTHLHFIQTVWSMSSLCIGLFLKAQGNDHLSQSFMPLSTKYFQ